MEAEAVAPRRGIALVGVILLMLGMTLLGHSLVVLAGVELRASRAGADQLRARAAAEAAIVAIVADTVSAGRGVTSIWSVGDSTSGALPDPLGRDSLHAARWWGRLRRLSREIWLSEGTGEAGPVASRSVAAPVWILDPIARVSEAAGVVVVGDTTSVRVDGLIDAAGFTAVPVVEPPGGCIDRLFALDSVRGPVALPEVGRGPHEVVVGIGRLGLAELLARAPLTVSGSGTPAPREEAAECRTDDPWNWGEPGRSARPCGEHLAMVAGDGGVRIEGGVGQGILLLEGDATLVDVEFYGIVVSDKRLFISGDTRIVGLVRAGGGAEIGPAASIVGSACWASAVLGHSAVTRPMVLARSGWIDPY